MSRPPRLRRVWAWSSLAVFVWACGITERTVDEAGPGGAGGNAVLGSSGGSGGGAVYKGGTGSVGGSVSKGTGGKPSFDEPDPAFPQFKNGGPCAPGTIDAFAATSGAGGESGANAGANSDAGAAGTVACARTSCESTLVMQALEPSPLVVRKGDVLFADNGTGELLETRIGGAPRLLTTLQAWVTDLAVDDDWVYLQTYSEILKVARAGGNLQTLAREQVPRGMALDSSHLYFLSDKNGHHEVRRLSRATGAGETLAELNWTPMRIALDDDDVYVLSKAELVKIPKCGERQTVLAATYGLGGGLALDAGFVYWYSDGVISRIPKATGDTQVVIEAGALEGGIAVDGAFAYWGEGSGEVRRAPVTGGGPSEIIGDGLTSPVVYAVDQENVYFTDAGTSEIRAVHR